MVDKQTFAKFVAGQRQHGGSSTSHNASEPKTQSTKGWETYRDMSGSGKSSSDHVSTAKAVCVCGKDARTVLQALRKQLKDLRGDVDHLLRVLDMGLELDGLKKVEALRGPW